MNAKANTKKNKKESTEETYTKEQIVKSKRFANNVDLLNATLKDSQKYTLKEVEQTINNYMKGKVN